MKRREDAAMTPKDRLGLGSMDPIEMLNLLNMSTKPRADKELSKPRVEKVPQKVTR